MQMKMSNNEYQDMESTFLQQFSHFFSTIEENIACSKIDKNKNSKNALRNNEFL